MISWIRSWLVCCVVFGIFLIVMDQLGKFNGLEHDGPFYVGISVSFILVSIASFLYFRDVEKRRQQESSSLPFESKRGR